MSGTDATAPQEFDAHGIGMQAAAWIQRRDFDHWTQADEAALDAWLNESPAHRIAFVRLDFGWQRTTRLAALKRPDSMADPLESGKPLLSTTIRAVAAVLVAVGVATGGYWFVRNMGRTTYVTPVGARETLTLKDGSQIELNTDTVLQMASRDGRREVWLEKGEAFFQIVHNPARPFIVFADNHRIVDVGTKFVVRRNAGKLRVAVIEGGVELYGSDTAASSAAKTLTAGDVAVADASSISVLKTPVRALNEALGWRRGVLVFHRTSLSEAAAQINRYGGKKLIVADPRIGHLMIGGTFQISNVMAFAEAAQDSFGVHIEDRGDEIVISR